MIAARQLQSGATASIERQGRRGRRNPAGRRGRGLARTRWRRQRGGHARTRLEWIDASGCGRDTGRRSERRKGIVRGRSDGGHASTIHTAHLGIRHEGVGIVGGIVAERRGRIRPRRSGCRAGLHGSPPDGNRRRHGRPRGRPRNLRARKGRPNERHRPNGLKLPDQGLRLRLLQTLPGAQVLGRDGLGHGGKAAARRVPPAALGSVDPTTNTSNRFPAMCGVYIGLSNRPNRRGLRRVPAGGTRRHGDANLLRIGKTLTKKLDRDSPNRRMEAP